ncbi:hypothetical protein BpHYR1_052642 [Brachionus plicatilis]|uniref:Uncharacterized protein n=1 Tax=Brachionus plicatilis TaxID=10195 RepID=A0A3M7S9W9_BRAPC|nr:hypothetical protein BpHYR1_052642 [Brachionus plicatilis]
MGSTARTLCHFTLEEKEATVGISKKSQLQKKYSKNFYEDVLRKKNLVKEDKLVQSKILGLNAKIKKIHFNLIAASLSIVFLFLIPVLELNDAFEFENSNFSLSFKLFLKTIRNTTETEFSFLTLQYKTRIHGFFLFNCVKQSNLKEFEESILWQLFFSFYSSTNKPEL